MRESERIWQRFAALPGAAVDGVAGIASEHAIGGLLALVRGRRPTRILELGAGIGTLTFTILEAVTELGIDRRPGYAFYTIENNEFCLGQLAGNLGGFAGRYRILRSTDELPKLRFDLIVVDGGGDLGNDMGVMSFDDRLARGGAILVEGGRSFQRQLIERWYGHRSFVYGKFTASNPTLSARRVELEAKNKPYHLFVFEPGAFEGTMLRCKSFGNQLGTRIRRRLRRPRPAGLRT